VLVAVDRAQRKDKRVNDNAKAWVEATGHFHATVGTRFSLAELNDEGDTFDTIAALIESEPPGLFVEDA
jgi:hypothetical protein